MSIETLLEAAKFLEWQAQQQQKAREDELKENLRLQQLTEERFSGVNYNSIIPINHVSKASKPEGLHTECCPAPIPPSLPPPSTPFTVIPIPVVTPDPTSSQTLPVATLSPPAAPPLTSPKREPHSPQEQSAAAPLCSPQPEPEQPTTAVGNNHKQPIQNHQHLPQVIAPASTVKVQQPTPQSLVQRYPGSIVSPPQQHPLHPHPGAALQPASLQNGHISRGSPPDDSRQLDGKKRPGGAGTREVHNKLEKHRRAHLKECFETLKKNIPNIDEKKTSNLSVLRSALRYIQILKRKEKEYEHDMERLAREKIATQQRLDELKNELSPWMDVDEVIDRVVRQPEEDQASTSTASEGEDVMDEDLEEEPAPRAPAASAAAPQSLKPDLLPAAAPSQAPTLTPITTATSFFTQHVSIQQKASLPQPLPATHPQPAAPSVLVATAAAVPPPPFIPNHAKLVTASSLHPTVIAHASVSHPSVIQAVNHVIQGGGPKHIAHLGPAPTATGSVHLGPGHQPIGHITVHPVAHLSQHLPALYPQPVAVTQPAVVGHITHTLNHAHPQVNGPAVSKSAPIMAHHPQLVGQTVLNPVTMVTMPSFPISTLKLA